LARTTTGSSWFFSVPDVNAVDQYSPVPLPVSDAGNTLLPASDYTIQISR
jgi:hypothetical protein